MFTRYPFWAASAQRLRILSYGGRTSLRRPQFLLQAALFLCLLLALAGFAGHSLALLYDGRYSVTRQDFWRIYYTDFTRSFPYNALCKHNDHPVLFPSLIWLPILYFFENDQTLLFFCGLVLTLGTLVLLWLSLWHSPTLPLLSRVAFALLFTVATLWAGKSNILASGGFSSMNSLVTIAAVTGLHGFARLAQPQPGRGRQMIVVAILAMAVIATFSFASGIAVWPTWVLLAHFLRLGRKMVATMVALGVLCIVIFLLLPNDSPSGVGGGLSLFATNPLGLLLHVTRILGAPWSLASEELLAPDDLNGRLLIAGAAGAAGLLILAGVAFRLWQTPRPHESAEVIAHGLILLILTSVALVALGRNGLMAVNPRETLAPRYFFWTTFFWAALPVAVTYRWRWLRKTPVPLALLALAATAFTIPSGKVMGSAYRQMRQSTEVAALRLACGAEDAGTLRSLFHHGDSRNVIEHLLPFYRQRRLDMFAGRGVQWLEQTIPAATPPPAPVVTGRWRIDHELPPTIRGESAAQFSGWALTKEGHKPVDYAIVSQADGRVVGFGEMSIQQRDLSLKVKLAPEAVVGFRGYISPYSIDQEYQCRPVVRGELIEQALRRIGR